MCLRQLTKEFCYVCASQSVPLLCTCGSALITLAMGGDGSSVMWSYSLHCRLCANVLFAAGDAERL